MSEKKQKKLPQQIKPEQTKANTLPNRFPQAKGHYRLIQDSDLNDDIQSLEE